MASVMVLGAGGLLGSEVLQRCRHESFGEVLEAPRIRWSEPDHVQMVVESTIERVVDDLDDRRLVVFWCAGAGYVGSSAAELEATTDALRAVLVALTNAVENGVSVHLCYASSAGAVWAGAEELPISESTPIAPTYAYGRAKVREEELVHDWSTTKSQSVTIVRISNLFGANQNLAKEQGLVTKLVSGTFRGEPVRLFVPLDTSRDYLPASTAAEMLVSDAQGVLKDFPNRQASSVRIIASGHSYTIAQVCGILQRLRRRRVPLVHVSPREPSRQPRWLSFKSNRPFGDVTIPTLEESLKRLFDEESTRMALAK